MTTRLKIQYAAPGAHPVYERNSRTHSEHQITQLMAAIEQFGFTNPLLVDGQGIIAGQNTAAGSQAVPGLGGLAALAIGAAGVRSRRQRTVA